MKHLSEFVYSIDLARARPLSNVVTNKPEHICESVLGVEKKDYCIYLADEREIDAPGYGFPISGNFSINLPSRNYDISLYSPVSGLYSPSIKTSGGVIKLDLQPFVHDICIRVRGEG